jgi:nicotinamidase/pyrazinamidase
MESVMKRVDLFIVDGQNDFCASGTEPAEWPWPFGGRRMGALHVAGADKEAAAVAAMIDRLHDPSHNGRHKIAKLHATLDKHQRNDGAHNTSWKGPDGKSPPPFTIVSHDDVKAQRWVPRFPVAIWEGKPVSPLQWALNYTAGLEKKGRNPLCLWPVHCQIETWGAGVYWPLHQAYDRWCEATNGWIDWISKGAWPFTEHYSAMQADVPDSTRPDTMMNADVVRDAMEADIIAWCGWAGSHCLKWTALDAVNFFGAGTNDFIKKSVFLEDACAPVPNPPGPGAPDFGSWRKEFLDEVSKRGATITTTTEFLKA